MPWDVNNGYIIPVFDDQMKKYYDQYVAHGRYQGSYDDFRKGKFFRFNYAAVQADLALFGVAALITEDARSFIQDATDKIKENSLNPVRIEERFLEELGLKTSLDMESGRWAIAIDYQKSDQMDEKIAKLLATECFSYGRPMVGNISKNYRKNPQSPIFTMKWTKATQEAVQYKIAISKIVGAGGSDWTTDVIRSRFLELHQERYVWGSPIQPQRIINEHDLPFAASVTVQVKLAKQPDTAYQTLPLKLAFNKIAIPVLDPNDISVTVI